MSDAIDPIIQARLQPIFESQKFLHHLGVEIKGLSAGYCEMFLSYQDCWSHQDGVFHSSVVGTLADSAAATAAATLLLDGERCLTAEYKLNFFTPAEGDALMAKSKIIKSGRSLKIAETNIYSIKDEALTHCATALVTLIAT